MNRLTKIVYFGILILISVVQLAQGNYILAAILFVLTGFALPTYEKREAKRRFYRAIRKLYVCVDLNAFIKEREYLVEQALFKGAISTPLRLLTNIEAYYNGQRESVAIDLSSMPFDATYQYWIDCYISLCDVSHVARMRISSQFNQVPRYYREIASQRFEVLLLMQKLQEGCAVDTNEIEALRERVTPNLLVAELTQCLGNNTQNARIQKYYEQAALNLSKGLKI